MFGPFSWTRRFTPAAATGAPSLSTLGVSPTSVVGGASSTGTVTLTAAAPTGGATVAVTSSHPAVTVPASVSVAAGATRATFSATTTSVASATAVTLTATFGGVSRTATLTVNPAGSGTLPAPSLLSPADDARFSAGQTITFDWSDVAGAASYTIQVDDQESFSSPTVQQSVSASTFSASALPTHAHVVARSDCQRSRQRRGGWSSARRFELR